jgi:hypothetical protein
MKIIGLREKVIKAVNQAIAPDGGYVDPDRVKQLSDGQEIVNDREEITITLVFSKEYRRLAQYIERCVQQAIHSPCKGQDCQYLSLPMCRDFLLEVALKSAPQSVEKRP